MLGGRRGIWEDVDGDGAEHATRGEVPVGGGGDAGEERVRRRVLSWVWELLSELHGEYEIFKGEIEVSECAETEAGDMDEEESGVE